MLTTGNFTTPREVVRSILSLLKHDPFLKELLVAENFDMGLEPGNLHN